MQDFFSNFIPSAILDLTFFENSVTSYLVAAMVLVGIISLYKLTQFITATKLKSLAAKTKSDLDELALAIVKSLHFEVALYVAIYLGALSLSLPELLDTILTVGLIILIIHQVISTAYIIIEYVVAKRIGDDASGHAQIATHSIGLAMQVALWSIGLLFTLSNFGIDVTSLIAALGVGGIAIAFALQQILSDLFGSFAIYFDKPFVPGDFVVVGNQMGTVEKIGIKTTRIKSLQGEELVFSNQELTSTTIQNYQRMSERRVVFEIRLVYATSVKKLRQAVDIIKDVIEQADEVRLDRVHFKKFDDSSLNIEAVYYCEFADYNQYMDVNQDIMFAIKEQFEKQSIDLAFPTRTVHIATPAK